MNALLSTIPSDALANLRTSYSSVSIQNFTPALVKEVQAIANEWGGEYLLNSGAVFNLNR